MNGNETMASKEEEDRFTREWLRTYSRKETPLHAACNTNNVDEVRRLLRETDVSQINIEDMEYKSPMYYAVSNAEKEIVKMLLEKDPDLLRKNSKESNAALLLKSVANCDVTIGQLLVENGVDANYILESDRKLWSPLHHACGHFKSANWRVVSMLINHGNAIVNAKNIDLETPLHLALAFTCNTKKSKYKNKGHRWRFDDIVFFLLEHGADTMCKTKLGKSPLYLAVENKSVRITRKLLEEYNVPIQDQVSRSVYMYSKG